MYSGSVGTRMHPCTWRGRPRLLGPRRCELGCREYRYAGVAGILSLGWHLERTWGETAGHLYRGPTHQPLGAAMRLTPSQAGLPSAALHRAILEGRPLVLRAWPGWAALPGGLRMEPPPSDWGLPWPPGFTIHRAPPLLPLHYLVGADDSGPPQWHPCPLPSALSPLVTP